MNRVRVAVVADLIEERWPSMDLVADMLFEQLSAPRFEALLEVRLLRPSLTSRGRGRGRYVNRYWDYSRWLRKQAGAFDVFHVVDHSYAHLVHVLPALRSVVTCHDVDAFMPLVDATVIPTRLPKVLTRLVLSGLRKAAWVSCDTAATRDEVRKYDFVQSSRLGVVPVGVHPALTPEPVPQSDAAVDRLLGPRDPDVVELLHVGSCIPRKRIDLLLRILAAVRDVEPRVRLLKAGGSLTAEQLDLARTLAVDGHIVQIPFLDTDTLAALYRRARVAVVTSEREGFGLPVVEALASGTPVVATDIPVLREVGGAAAAYAALGDIAGWREVLLATLRGQGTESARAETCRAGVAQAGRFTWASFAESMAATYLRVASDEVDAVA